MVSRLSVRVQPRPRTIGFHAGLLLAFTVVATPAHAAMTLPVTLPGDISAAGVSPDGVSVTPDGQLIAFQSSVTFIADSTAPSRAIYVLNRVTDQLELISKVPSAGHVVSGFRSSEDNVQITDNGRYVSFEAEGVLDGGASTGTVVWIADRFEDELILGSAADGGVLVPGDAFSANALGAITRDGRAVIFSTNYTGYVGDDANGLSDIFMHDLATLQTRRINLQPDGSELEEQSLSPVPSIDGRYVLFSSYDNQLVPDDDNGRRDVFITDTQTGTVMRANVGRNGEQISGGQGGLYAFSGDGRYVLFESRDAHPPSSEGPSDAIAVFDRTQGSSVPLHEYIGTNFLGFAVPAFNDVDISDDGRLVAFTARDLLPTMDRPQGGASHLYLADAVTHEVVRIDQGLGQEVADLSGFEPVIAHETGSVFFQSAATNLGGDDSTIMYERIPGVANTSISISGPPEIESDGGVATYAVVLSNLSARTLSDGYAVINCPDSNGFEASAPGGQCSQLDTQSVIHCVLPAIAPGESATISLEADPFRLRTMTPLEIIAFGGSIGDFDVAPVDNKANKTFLSTVDSPDPVPSGGAGGGTGVLLLFGMLGAIVSRCRGGNRAVSKEMPATA